MRFFLISTKRLADRLLFRDDDDFIQAMNYVPVSALSTGVVVLAFILMSNHVHIILQCEEYEAKNMIDRFKRLYGAYYCKKYQVSDFLRRLPSDIRELKIHDESLQRGIAYVHCNCVAANIVHHSSLYEWGTGSVFFSDSKSMGQSLSEFTLCEQRRILRTWTILPKEYRLSERGYILPESYVPVAFVENVFRTPKSYNYFLSSSSKAKIHLEKSVASAFRDQVVLAAIPDLCHSLFRVHTVGELDDVKKSELLKQLARRFSADNSQLSRVTGISADEITRLLDIF
jgi:REP element-mobilizing transposase RayT